MTARNTQSLFLSDRFMEIQKCGNRIKERLQKYCSNVKSFFGSKVMPNKISPHPAINQIDNSISEFPK